ncbi:MAG: hypothetical protein ACRC5C_12235 [Bacilli bacterium]
MRKQLKWLVVLTLFLTSLYGTYSVSATISHADAMKAYESTFGSMVKSASNRLPADTTLNMIERWPVFFGDNYTIFTSETFREQIQLWYVAPLQKRRAAMRALDERVDNLFYMRRFDSYTAYRKQYAQVRAAVMKLPLHDREVHKRSVDALGIADGYRTRNDVDKMKRIDAALRTPLSLQETLVAQLLMSELKDKKKQTYYMKKQSNVTREHERAAAGRYIPLLAQQVGHLEEETGPSNILKVWWSHLEVLESSYYMDDQLNSAYRVRYESLMNALRDKTDAIFE